VIVAVCPVGGALNGFICHRFGANPLIVTIGVYAIFQAAILVWTKGNISATPPVSLTTVFMLSAVLSGLTGMLVAGYASGASPGMGDPYLFQGLTAVIVGGTAIGTARGDCRRTVLGALILTALTTVIIGKGFGGNDTQILFGVVILIVVAAYRRERRVRERV
jgi:ribose/xylose/arabinose/galactoside ABC-type transport system permease subunit